MKTKYIGGAIVLLIAASMILSAIPVTANTTTANVKGYNPNKFSRKNTPETGTTFQGILEEGFEDGVMPPPGGWYTIDENTNRPWTIVDKPTNPDYIHNGEYAGWVNYDSEFSHDNWLVSPDIAITGDEAYLIFWALADTNWPGATVELWIRGASIEDVMLWDMIADEVWEEFIYREMSFDISNYIGETINISWRYVGFDGQSFGLDDIFVGVPLYPDLDCDGELTWVDVETNTTVEGEFTISNVGDAESLLNWEITEFPEWGEWEFDPENGIGLTPEDSPLTIEVSVLAPTDQETEFTGEVKIVNVDSEGDFCIIDVSLTTPRSKNTISHTILQRLKFAKRTHN